MNYEIVTIEKRVVIGITKKINNIEKAVKDISDMWVMFNTKDIYSKISDKTQENVLGIYYDYEGDYTKPYKFMIGKEIKKQICGDKFTNTTIPAGKYAKFTAKGNVKKIVGEIWEAIWSMNLDRAYTYDFEEYHNMSDLNNTKVDIYIALKP
ncbi:GyrI-like domain-containing protein [Clostridiaceae bacterium M8S5]|nr:GyrI-like domain-containing protein [Clostridiaceae bacterium M8S5]